MVSCEVLIGTPNLSIDDVVHILIPGRGRGLNGKGLSPFSLARVKFAAEFYKQEHLNKKGGVIVCCGYKTPSDKSGKPWSSEEDSTQVYSGIPEGYAMKQKLIDLGIPEQSIRVEAKSFDTVTNFANAEAGNYFTDDKPVAIIAQRQHLERIMEVIAPKTLKRAYLGIVVPESKDVDTDSYKSRILSKTILLGIKPEASDLASKAELRAMVVWRLTNPPGMLKSGKPYKTGSSKAE